FFVPRGSRFNGSRPDPAWTAIVPVACLFVHERFSMSLPAWMIAHAHGWRTVNARVQTTEATIGTRASIAPGGTARMLAHPWVSVGCPYTYPIHGHRVRQRPPGSLRFFTHAMGRDGVGNAWKVNRTLAGCGKTPDLVDRGATLC